MSAAPAFDVRTRKNTPPPCRRQAARKGSTESCPRYGLTVTASASGGPPSRGSRNALAYARAVEPMSPRLASAITSNPAWRAYAATDLEGAPPVRAERLEERDLRLDGHADRCDGVDDPLAEALDRSGGGLATLDGRAAQLHRQTVDARVEPDHELRALSLDRGRQPVGEWLRSRPGVLAEPLRHAESVAALRQQPRTRRAA